MKMEVVLAGPESGGGAGAGPFRNEDVREWSRLDRLTGMLERARVETGRWRADTEDAAQSYGKMIDSRERNSADGSLVQKARRQVEIFQSQGTGGRSFQVVRASQWSSSRATDCAFDVALTNKPHNNTDFLGPTTNGGLAPLPAPRLSLWRSNLDSSADLERLSCLCRKLHDEALYQGKQLWALRSSALSPSPSSSSLEDEPLPSSRFIRDITDDYDEYDDNDRPAGTNGYHPEQQNGGTSHQHQQQQRRSNSSEDLSMANGHGDADAFSRDSKLRRSLQISANNGDGETEARVRPRPRNELIAERARKFEEHGQDRNPAGEPPPARRNFISTKSFTPIANNDFVRNDPKHPSKIAHAKLAVKDNAQNGTSRHHPTSPVLPRSSAKPETAPVPAARHKTTANNRTVVLLRTNSPGEEPSRCVNVTAVKLDNGHEPAEEHNGHYGVLADSSSTREDGVPTTTTTTTTTTMVNGNGPAKEKPVKRVEFCKTEIHFAADSGKVNIVETDGKPPPTNKFRRRRRNHGLVANSSNPQKSGMPLVHFGDTSYEKYIFGGQGKPGPGADDAADKREPRDRAEPQRLADEGTVMCTTSTTNGGSSNVMRELGAYSDFFERSADSYRNHRGAHTTTVNFLGDEPAGFFAKSTEDKPSSLFSPASLAARKKIEAIAEKFSKKKEPTEPSSNNPVQLKVIATSKPVLSRSSPGRSSSPDKRRSSSPDKRRSSSPERAQTKDDCDTRPKEAKTAGVPVYENIFDAISDGPLYENFQAGTKDEAKRKTPVQEPTRKTTKPKPAETSNKTKSPRSATPLRTTTTTTTTSRDKSSPDARRATSGSVKATRDPSLSRRQKEVKTTRDETPSSRKSSFKSDSATRERKTASSRSSSVDKNTDTLKKKKPVEVVYQTAVYNMKNEKLSKSAKAKETKGPRLINDLICGSKLRRPSDKKIKST